MDKINIVDAVTQFMKAADQTIDVFNTRQAALYTGLQAEEFAEKLEALFAGCDKEPIVLTNLKHLAADLKSGVYDAHIAKACRLEMLDADVDLLWVTVGSARSQGALAHHAISEVARSNLSKLGPDGKMLKDENGKVKKPEGYSPPDLSRFIFKE